MTWLTAPQLGTPPPTGGGMGDMRWHLTEPPPQLVSDVIAAELEVLRQQLLTVIQRSPKTPINIAAAVAAVADIAAYLVDQAEAEQDRLAVRLEDRQRLEEVLANRLQYQLTQMRAERSQGQKWAMPL